MTIRWVVVGKFSGLIVAVLAGALATYGTILLLAFILWAILIPQPLRVDDWVAVVGVVALLVVCGPLTRTGWRAFRQRSGD